MVRLEKIYTRGGDGGKTSLGDGTRVEKFDQRVEAYGTVDEANASIGLARLHVSGDVDVALARIQNDLFDLGADLCRPHDEKDPNATALRITDGQVVWLETQIDTINENLEPLNSFILPGGTPAAAYLHLSRTIVRRAERLNVALSAKETVNAESIKYLNRLSDYLFVLSRHVNNGGR
ncbi:MAG: cob(I)yrinic acid a,c-diamide adenosyltransferase, partial [Proteobacteria bacterium]|nr:cob(I)yrinic acid a,c-diamide adenosyltransferase [Pseudomonadota bacterium]